MRLDLPATIITIAALLVGAYALANYQPPKEPETYKLLLPLGNVGAKLVSLGVIDKEKFLVLYAGSPALRKEAERLLSGAENEQVTVTEKNAPVVLNILWAIGLSNKNPILENGPMMDSKYGGAGNFASTGGWTLSGGNPMDHYSRYPLIVLTPEQQNLVERVSKNIYRPCCDNPAYFPDCNHGMAMLGMLELLAWEGKSEAELYRAALDLNEYWFPDTYATIDRYLRKKGQNLATADPKEIVGRNYSSASGYRRILEKVNPPLNKNAASCGA